MSCYSSSLKYIIEIFRFFMYVFGYLSRVKISSFFCFYHRFTHQKCPTCHLDAGVPALHEFSRVVVEERPMLNSELYDCWPPVFGPIYFEIFLLRDYLSTEMIQREVSTDARVLILSAGRHRQEKSGRASR